MLCENCGANLKNDEILCSVCGYSLKEASFANKEIANLDNSDTSISGKLQKAYDEAYNKMPYDNNKNLKKLAIGVIAFICIVVVVSIISSSSKFSGVLMEQIEMDISELPIVSKGVIESTYTPVVPYSVDKIEIEKRQTNIDDKEDIVYCNVKISNQYYQTNLLIKLVYNFYDDGGWFLEENNLEQHFSIPLSGVDSDLVFKSMKDKYKDFEAVKSGWALWESYVLFKGLDGKEHSLSPKDCGITFESQTFSPDSFISSIKVKAFSSLTNITGYIDFFFDDKKGWMPSNYSKDGKEIVILVQNVTADYTEAYLDFQLLYGCYSIEKIDIENKLIYFKEGSIISNAYGETKTSDFNVYSGSFNCPYYVVYSPSLKNWIYSFGDEWYKVGKIS